MSEKHSHTRKGVHANHPGIKLVNVCNGTHIKRIPKNIASDLVARGDWAYVPKKYKLEQ